MAAKMAGWCRPSAMTQMPPRIFARWDQIDPQAQIAALVLLSRLIAQKLVAKSARESGDE
jgi:hypothetical protein